MIFYFSATGNSQYTAERIAAALDEQTISMNDCLHSNSYSFSLKEGEMLGFVTPVYLGSLPQAVLTFLERMEISSEGTHYTWHVVTYGRTALTVSRQLANVLDGKGITLQTAFHVRMLSAYTPSFDVSDAAKVAEDVAAAEPRIDRVIEEIKAEKIDSRTVRVTSGNKRQVRMLGKIYDRIRKTQSFHVEDSCVGCGKCAEFCPDQAITMENGEPVWTSDKCSFCLGCLHRCPQFAIQYGDKTQKHGQYLHPGIRKDVNDTD